MITSLGLAGALVGCALYVTEPVQSTQVPEMQPLVEPRPQLAAARDRQINLFGELPGRPDVPYFSRTGSALLQHTYAEEGADFDPHISADGRSLIFASTRHNEAPDLYYKAASGVAVTQLTSDPAADVQPAYSPDGTKVAFASNRAGNWDIWIVGLDGQKPVQITSSAADEIHPSWSLDGRQIVYSSLPARGQWELWLADPVADGTKRFIGYGLFPEWSPAGRTIVYQRARERGSRWFSVWTIQLVDGEPLYPTEVAASADAALITPTWSRDGTQLAYTAVVPVSGVDPSLQGNATESADIWIVDADGNSRVRLTDGHTSNFGPVWSPEGRVFFTSSRAGHEAIWSLVPVGPDDNVVPRTASGKSPSLESTETPADDSGGAKTASYRPGNS